MKQFFLTLFLFATICAVAQDKRDSKKEFDDFKKRSSKEFSDFKTRTAKEYNDFREKANAEYAEFMRRAWEEFNSSPAIPVPPSPEPPEPVIAEPQQKPSAERLPVQEIVPAAPKINPPQPVAPVIEPKYEAPKPESKPELKPEPKPEIAEPEKPAEPDPTEPIKSEPFIKPDFEGFAFDFYNTACKVRISGKQKIVMSDISEQSAADIWTLLSSPAYTPLINDCLFLRRELKLCDWAYYQLVKTFAGKYAGENRPNEAVMFQAYILTQSGYKVRLASTDNKLTLLIPISHTVYEYSYLTIDEAKYYVMDKSLKGSKFKVFNRKFPVEQALSLQIAAPPAFNFAASAPKTFVSKRYPEVEITVETNRNLIDFYNSYPVTSDWNLYHRASLSEPVKKKLYPVLQRNIAGKSKAEAANILIDFVQTAFKYQSDETQFGYERPLFADEIFHYPASDCEDRAILYSILVRELLGLEIVFLHYQGHVSTAVHFKDEEIQGDYLILKGKKFTVCDPTFIGAKIGRSMETYKNAKAKVYEIVAH